MRGDNVRWKSDPARRGNDYHDLIEITLPRTGTTAEGSLLVRAINTHLSESAFETLFGYLGDESLPFLYRIEHDPSTIGLIKGWMEECGLHVDAWDGTSWKSAGVILPEANEVPFTRIVRITAPEGAKDSVRIRLRMLAEAWEIDAVGVDWSRALPLEEHDLPLISAAHSRSGPVDRALRGPDAEYAMLLPGESVDVTFRAYEPPEGRALRYACHASGYLYEWLGTTQAGGGFPDPFASFGPDRMNVAGYYLRNHDAFLPVLFARWDASGGTSR
jgi:hypothetical protein